MAKIKTTGEIRQRLVDMMSEIETGAIDIQKATAITKVAAQINESIYAEIKVARLKIDAGEKKADFGSLAVSGVSDESK